MKFVDRMFSLKIGLEVTFNTNGAVIMIVNLVDWGDVRAIVI